MMKMKCVCGYEYERDWINGDLVTVKGNAPFIPIFLEGHKFSTYDKRGDRTTAHLMMCPECKTVRVE